MSNDGDTLPEFEDAIDDEDDDLMLTCWSCGEEFPTGTYGYPVDKNQGVAAEACPNCGMHLRTPPLAVHDFDTIFWGPEDHPSHTLGEDEVYRRLPALNLIGNQDIRDEVARLSADAPAYFWMAPAASPMSNYHHPVCRETSGLWAHTLMLIAPLCRLAESWLEQDRLTIEERDYALAAALLHDQRKRGPHGTTETSAASEHDVHMARVIDEESDLPVAVADAVASHMGPAEWGYEGPEPETAVQDLVHAADMLASTPNVTPAIPGPIPEELAEYDLQEADL